jgi:hypothetical protein
MVTDMSVTQWRVLCVLLKASIGIIHQEHQYNWASLEEEYNWAKAVQDLESWFYFNILLRLALKSGSSFCCGLSVKNNGY